MRRTAGAAKAAVVLLGAAHARRRVRWRQQGSSSTDEAPATAGGRRQHHGGRGRHHRGGRRRHHDGAAAKGGTITCRSPDKFTGYNTGTSTENLIVEPVRHQPGDPVARVLRRQGRDSRSTRTWSTSSKTSDSPLTVDVKINPKAVWDDGAPIACDDIYLYWVAQNGKLKKTGSDGKETGLFNNATTVGFDQIKDVDVLGRQQDSHHRLRHAVLRLEGTDHQPGHGAGPRRGQARRPR